MDVNFRFWAPTEVDKIILRPEKSSSYKITEFILKIGAWADRHFYIGSEKVLIHNIQNLHRINYRSLLKGRAKNIHLHDATLIFFDHENPQPKNIASLSLKIVLCCIFSPVLLPIKFCYKYLFVRSYFYTYQHYNPHLLAELLKKYPDDPDLICLNLSRQYQQLRETTKQPSDDFYPKLQKIIQNIQALLLKHPNHEHAQRLINDIAFLDFSVATHLPLEFITKENDWFDFMYFIRDNSKKKTEFSERMFKLLEKVKSAEDKKNFRNLLKCNIHHKYIENNTFLNSMIYLDSFIERIGQNAYIELLNWLIDKEETTFISKYRQTLLSVFYLFFKRPFLQNVSDLENRLLNYDAGFTQEYQERHLLANLFGIKGKSAIGPAQFKLAGFSIKKLEDYIYPLLQKILAERMQKIEHQKKSQQLLDCLANNIRDFSSQLCSNETDLKDEKTGIVTHHAWSQVRFKEFLLIGNQGYGCGNVPGILIFKIDPKRFDKNNSKKYQLFNESSLNFLFGFDQSYLKQEYFNGLDAQFIGHIPFPYQKMRNCTSKAIQLNQFSHLFILNAYESLHQGVDFKTVLRRFQPECKTFVKEVMQPIKAKLLESYLERHRNPKCPREADKELLNQIGKKAKKRKWTNAEQLLERYRQNEKLKEENMRDRPILPDEILDVAILN